jgi:hypothetical protein
MRTWAPFPEHSITHVDFSRKKEPLEPEMTRPKHPLQDRSRLMLKPEHQTSVDLATRDWPE